MTKEEKREYDRQYWRRPEVKERAREYRRRPEVMGKNRKRAAEFRSKHPEYHANWQRENKDHVNAYKRDRRKRLKQEAAP